MLEVDFKFFVRNTAKLDEKRGDWMEKEEIVTVFKENTLNINRFRK